MFHRLSLADRARLLWENGTFVDSVMHFPYTLMLYSVNRSFVELIYDRSAHRIVWISLATGHDLNKYLADVHIPV